ncbi:MAG: amidase [Chloroflexi bacterium]|nr:amidase [Chloroflexota bacterium]
MNAESYAQPLALSADLKALQGGALSLSALLDALEARFHATEPAVKAYLPEPNRFRRLRKDAEQLQRRYPDPASRPSLFGALLGVKDIFHVRGFITRAGTDVPPALFAGEEATVISRLKTAGALIVGKTVTTEFAYFEPGATRNPHNLNHSPGGSSSGSAAAIAGGLAQLSTGTQTVGSVIRPAAYCGIVGFKPSFGRVPTKGLVTFSQSADHVGFFTADVAAMRQTAPVVVDGWRPVIKGEERPVLAVPEGEYLRQSTALDAFEAQLRTLEKAGFRVKRIGIFDDIEAIDARHQDLIAAELADQHRDWFPQHSQRYRPRTADLIRYGQTVSTQRVEEARAHRHQLRRRLHQVMDAEGIDLWLCPAAPDVAPRGLDATGSPKMNMPWTHAGLPALSLPAGRGMLGLPLGLQAVAHFNNDEELLAWAAEIEPLFRG